MSNDSDENTIESESTDMSVDSNSSLSNVNERKGDIKTFADFQNANIASIREELVGKSAVECLEYLGQLQERFAFEIWSVKEKSHAAEILKNQIKKEVEGAKRNILPDYNPDNLSGKSKGKGKSAKAVATSSQEKKDKTLAMFKAMGISEDDAKVAMDKMMAETFQKASSKLEAKPLPKKCPKCGMFILTGTSCLLCKVDWKECESCNSLVKEVSTKVVGNGSKMEVCEACKSKE